MFKALEFLKNVSAYFFNDKHERKCVHVFFLCMCVHVCMWGEEREIEKNIPKDPMKNREEVIRGPLKLIFSIKAGAKKCTKYV